MTPKQLMKLPTGRYALKDHEHDYRLDIFTMGPRNYRYYRLSCLFDNKQMNFHESVNSYDYDNERNEIYLRVGAGNIVITKTVTNELHYLEFKGNGSFKELAEKQGKS